MTQPTYADPDVVRLRSQVAQACRILARRGLAPGILGHISVRVADTAILVRCRGPQERGLAFTTPADVRLLDLDGAADPGEGYRPPNELPLHTETLRRRPEVNAVVHAHPSAVVVADLAGLELRPILGAYNMPAMRLAQAGIPVYPRGVLIHRAELAAEMLTYMGTRSVCVLRAHGLTAIGENVPQAVVRALDVDELARVTLAVARAGGPAPTLPAADVAELPDLGSGLNEETVWRWLVAETAEVSEST